MVAPERYEPKINHPFEFEFSRVERQPYLGVDLVADVFTTVLEERPDVQLLAVGPVVDLYGRFSAAKLNRLMEMFPGRVFSRPEFTALPQFVFSGGDFALIPSR